MLDYMESIISMTILLGLFITHAVTDIPFDLS